MQVKNYTVLGGGLVGGFIARQLAGYEDARVRLIDRDLRALAHSTGRDRLETVQADLGDPGAIDGLVAGADIVVGAVPGYLGFQTLAAVIRAGRTCVDISFFPEDARELDAEARHHGVPVVVDCGVMPGLGGVIAARLASRLSRADSLTIMVGGLPVDRNWPFEYRAPFSPCDVLEEYTRPARLQVNGLVLTRPALSDRELIEFPGLGTLEAFNTDGLRSLLHNLDIPTMVEKTLRYPGHAEKVRLLRDMGFLDATPLTIGDSRVSPLAVSSALLFDNWRLEPGMREFTVMRVEVSGQHHNIPATLGCDLLDFTDPATLDFSMARTTGWPAVLTARALAHGTLEVLRDRTGVIFPETIGADRGYFNYLIDGLESVGVGLKFTPGRPD